MTDMQGSPTLWFTPLLLGLLRDSVLPGLPHGWQGPRHLSQHLMPPLPRVDISRKLEWEAELGLIRAFPSWKAGVPCNVLTVVPNICPWQLQVAKGRFWSYLGCNQEPAPHLSLGNVSAFFLPSHCSQGSMGPLLPHLGNTNTVE